MDQKFRLKIIIASLIAVLVAGIVVALVVGNGAAGGGDSDSFNIVPFLPIWIAVFIPILAARQQREREKAKRQFSAEDEDIYSMMNRLVNTLDDDETDYLKQRLQRKFGDRLGSQG